MKRKKNAIFAKKSFVIIKIKKKKLNYTKKSEIIVIILKKLEDQLLVFGI